VRSVSVYPCAFVTLKAEATATAENTSPSAATTWPALKAPRTVMFGPSPKTSTSKIQKFVLRERANANV
jgi:fatty-acyl-CoA synthase